MEITSAHFSISSPDVTKCPKTDMPEYAFIGRSNVGKSSLINMLVKRKDLAKTSATPGKTMLINHFVINDSWNLVDLPGYGYAKRSKEDRIRLEKMIKSYILHREQLTNLFVLIDGRHLPQRIDLEFLDWLGENQVPFGIVFTKLDKMTSSAAKKVIGDYLATLLERWEELPPIFRTSSKDSRGRIEILNYIEQINNQIQNINTMDTSINNNDSARNSAKNEQYPGIAIDVADDEKVDAKLVKERTNTLNNNPENDD